MKMITTLAAGAAMAFAAIPFANPAMAQGAEGKFPVPRAGCPKTHVKSKRSPDTVYYCYPKEGSNGESSSSSSSGSSGGAVYTPPTYGSIKKASKMDRCPVGYWTDQNDITSCVSPYQDKAPASRLKKGGACVSGEVDEWGVYCTSRLHKLSRSEAENTAVADVNNLYVLSNGGTSPQGAGYENTPGIVALFAGANALQASDARSSGDQLAAQQTAQCTTDSGSAKGAAIGGAVGGDAGAALGGMLGGLGKKKKKKGC